MSQLSAADDLAKLFLQGAESPVPSMEISLERRAGVTKAMRELTGLSFADVAERSGLGEPFLQAFEDGKKEGRETSHLMVLNELAEGASRRGR